MKGMAQEVQVILVEDRMSKCEHFSKFAHILTIFVRSSSQFFDKRTKKCQNVSKCEQFLYLHDFIETKRICFVMTSSYMLCHDFIVMSVNDPKIMFR